jgi:transcriptional regulator of acetoin/glycerol metabolism
MSAPVAAAVTEAAADAGTVAGQERHMIVEALRRANGGKSRAAAALGLSRFQLLRRLRRHGLDASSHAPSDHGAPGIRAIGLAT